MGEEKFVGSMVVHMAWVVQGEPNWMRLLLLVVDPLQGHSRLLSRLSLERFRVGKIHLVQIQLESECTTPYGGLQRRSSQQLFKTRTCLYSPISQIVLSKERGQASADLCRPCSRTRSSPAPWAGATNPTRQMNQRAKQSQNTGHALHVTSSTVSPAKTVYPEYRQPWIDFPS